MDYRGIERTIMQDKIICSFYNVIKYFVLRAILAID